MPGLASIRQLFSSYLKDSYREKNQGDSSSLSLENFFSLSSSWLRRIHPSWITSHIIENSLSFELTSCLLALLPAEQREWIRRELQHSEQNLQMNQPFLFLLESYLSPLFPSSKLPPLFSLSSHSLFFLLQWKREQLHTLVSLLGLCIYLLPWKYDVGAKDKKKFASFLSDEQLDFLSFYWKRAGPFPPFFSNEYRQILLYESTEKFQYQVEKRGLAILRALFTENKDPLLWYLSRHLEEKRGKILEGMKIDRTFSLPSLLSVCHTYMMQKDS